MNLLGRYPGAVAATLLAPPVSAWVLGFFQPSVVRQARPPLNWIYSSVIFTSCVPGMLATTLTAYALFFTRSNLMQMNVFATFLPIVAMGLTLFLVGRKVEFTPLPGFERLSSLILVLGLTFFLLIILERMRVLVVFGGSLMALFVIGLVFFITLRTATKKLFGK
jgi:hypothetical protein